MRRERYAKLLAEMDRRGVGAAVLILPSNVAYAGGARAAMADGDRAGYERTVVIAVKGQSAPHLFTSLSRRRAARNCPPITSIRRFIPTSKTGVRAMARPARHRRSRLSEGLAIDEYTAAMYASFRKLLAGVRIADAGPMLHAVRLCKDRGRDRMHPASAADQRTRDVRRAGAGAPGGAAKRADGSVPAPDFRAGGHRQRRRSDLAADGPGAATGDLTPPTAISRSHWFRPTASCAKATCCGSIPESCTRAMRRTTVIPGWSAIARAQPRNSAISSSVGVSQGRGAGAGETGYNRPFVDPRGDRRRRRPQALDEASLSDPWDRQPTARKCR